MEFAIAFSFLFGLFIGTFIGAVSIALGVMAKRNVDDMPETPIEVRRDAAPVPIRS